MIYLPKSQPAPPCLEEEKDKASGTYNCEGVLERLKMDFHNKCYICEDKEPHSINTEHFKPKERYQNLIFEWNNLFYSCSHCNNIKLAKPIYDDILNCTIEDEEVDKKIKYHLNPYPREQAVISANEDSQRVHNTVHLLLAVYNGTTEMKTIESGNLRSKLLSEIRRFQDLLFEYDDDLYNADEKEKVKEKIIRELRPGSNFTAFKRWILREHRIGEDFKEYL